MKNLLSLLDQIKVLRCRAAEDLPHLCRIGSECISHVRAAKAQKITLIEHRSRRYALLSIGSGGKARFARPVREDLFVWDPKEIGLLLTNVSAGLWNPANSSNLERLVYTLQQGVAMYLDLFHPAAARKVVGTFFEALVASSLNRVCGLCIGSGTVRVPDVNETIMTDLGLLQDDRVVLLVATKTSTRERLSQPFVQKKILEQAFPDPPKSILIVVGDVQRIGVAAVQHTFTAGQFLLYWKYLTPLDGVFYIDVPPQAETAAFQNRLKPLSQLFSSDLELLLKS